MKTHPDAVGSDRLMSTFLAFSAYYEEAKQTLDARESSSETKERSPQNDCLAFFQTLNELETRDMPYRFVSKYGNGTEDRGAIDGLKARARDHLTKWNPAYAQLYAIADSQYDQLKREKPSGPYLKHALALNVLPVVHNIIAYNLSGIGFYKKQVRQNLDAILQKLQDRRFHELRDFLLLLIQEMDAGPAIFRENSGKRSLPP